MKKREAENPHPADGDCWYEFDTCTGPEIYMWLLVFFLYLCPSLYSWHKASTAMLFHCNNRDKHGVSCSEHANRVLHENKPKGFHNIVAAMKDAKQYWMECRNT